MMIANDNLRIEQGDHVIMFLTDKKFVSDAVWRCLARSRNATPVCQ
ncbi:hypothetical protein HZD82_22930 [Pantoea agglomerans]|nr:hypothetical protein [Pantoea agglomerans]